MGKKLFLFAAAAVALASCTETDLSGDTSFAKESTSDAIQFSAKAGNSAVTRAVENKTYNSTAAGTIGNADAEGITALKKARFGVFAYHTTSTDYSITPASNLEPNFMYNQELQWSNTEPENMWIYSPVKYWPNGIDSQNSENAPSNSASEVLSGGKLSFFAFAPYTAATANPYVYSATTDTKPDVLGGASTDKDANIKKTSETKGVTAITSNDWTGNVWVKYELGTDANSANEKNFVDLLWGTRGSANYNKAGSDANDGATIGDAYNINLTKQTVDEKVSFLFKHALVKVGGATAQAGGETETGDPARSGFKVVVDVDGNNGDNQTSYFPAGFKNSQTLVTIKEVKIQDGYSAGQDVAVTTVENTTKSNLNTYGWFNIETGAWCNEANTFGNTGDGARYDITVNNDKTLTNDTYLLNEKILEIGAGKYGAGGGKKELKDGTGEEWSTTNPTGVTATPQPLFANENVPGLMIIPGGSADLYITVDYFVRTADKNLNKGYTEVEQTITNKVSLGTLDPNKFYTIIMHIGLTSVKFEAVVADWAAKANEAYDEQTGEDKSTGDDNESKVWLPSNVVAYAVSYNVNSDATNKVVDFGSFANVGEYVNYTKSGTGISTVEYTAPNATINLTANTTSNKVTNNIVTLKGTTGKVVVTIIQDAKAIAFGTPSSGTFDVTGPTDLDLSTATITVSKGGTNYSYDATADAEHFSYDNSASPKTITLPTGDGTYTVTVTQHDATITSDVTR